MVEWRIYYGDGTTLDSSEVQDLYQVPGLNVQAIAQVDGHIGRYVLHHMDFYWWVEGQWHQGDHFGLWDYLQRPGPKKVIFGRSLDNVSYQKIVNRALYDEDFLGRAP
jgi:hypothetical protein